MNESLRKSLLYFRSTDAYWQSAPSPQQDLPKERRLGIYPISMVQRIRDGHHCYFDSLGVPVWPDTRGRLRHSCTTMTSYALGHWELWLLTGKGEHRDAFLRVADFLLAWGRETDSGGTLFLDYEDDTETNGHTCAMNQGEAISVLCRAYELTGRERYVECAWRAGLPFRHRYGPEGVTGRMNDSPWYLEGGKRILNGHIYAVFGLWDLAQVTQQKAPQELFEAGAESVVREIDQFDSGDWSWYWVESPRYIASMMYHNLHICQLEALNELYPAERISAVAARFRHYAKRPLNRAKAALALVRGKLRMRRSA